MRIRDGGRALVAVIALVVGAGIGVSGNQDQGRIDDLEEQVADLEDDVTEAERDAEDAEQELADQGDALDAREDELRSVEREQAREAARKRRELPSREREIAAAEQELESSTIPDRIWEAGRDFEPGLYRSPGGEGCYWAKLGSANTDDIQNMAASARIRPCRLIHRGSRRMAVVTGCGLTRQDEPLKD